MYSVSAYNLAYGMDLPLITADEDKSKISFNIYISSKGALWKFYGIHTFGVFIL